jgi:hypothetical protein
MDFFTFAQFMKNINHISVLSYTFVVIFLYTFIVSLSVNFWTDYPKEQGYNVSKSSSLPSKSDNQLPYEEREIEKDDDPQQDFFFVCQFGVSAPVLIAGAWCELIHSAPLAIGTISDIPLYLADRSLRI